MSGRALASAAVLLVALFAFACDRDAASDGARSTPDVTAGTHAAPTVETLPELDPAMIGPRADLPHGDAIALAQRYGVTDASRPTSIPLAVEPAIGSARQFNILRITTAAAARTAPPEQATITATLHATSAHAYFYVDDAIGADREAVVRAAELFEASAWPEVTRVFGLPDTPGIDGDPRVIVLQSDIGASVGGYFNGDDTLPRAVRPLSNEAEMVYLSQSLRPGGALYDQVLAHELQHMVHDVNDPGEESWVNEGLSDTAALLVGGGTGNRRRFEAAPETQLNAWPQSGTSPHYGAGASFLRYVADQFGGDVSLGAIAREAKEGPAGVDAYLQAHGTPLRFADVFADWIVANVVEGGTGAFGGGSSDVVAAVQYELAAGESAEAEAPQFGTHYYGLTGVYDGGTYVLRFEGEGEVAPLPPPFAAWPSITPLEDGRTWWSNRGDEIDTTLTFAVMGSSATELAVEFETWHDIEEWYDWGYVSVSTDGGTTWRALAGEHTSEEDPVQVAYGPGYTGVSGGGEEAAWVEERIDLSGLATPFLLRFEYVTDAGTHGEGWAVRNVRLDGASGNVGWGAQPEATGWIDPRGRLTQEYAVRLVVTHDDGRVEALDVALDGGREGEVRFETAGVADAVVAVAGMTEGTYQAAPYRIELTRVKQARANP